MNQSVLYKIRRRGTRTYSTGGTNPRFTKRGKAWSIGDLRKHLNLISPSTQSIYNNECELVQFVESDSTLNLQDI